MALSAKRGELLSQLKPFVHCLSSDQLPHYCSHCVDNEEDASLLRCSGCKILRYCNAECQKADWKFHRLECKCLQNVKELNPPVPYEVVRLIVRILIRRKKQETKLFYDDKEVRSFDQLMSHADDIKKDPTRSGLFYKLCSSLAIYTKGIQGLALPGEKELLDIYGKICINSFGLNIKGVSTGVAIYLSSSSLDHSCDPDACAIVNGTIQEVRAIRDFTYNKYADFKVSYTNLLAPSWERRDDLRKQYYFICKCERCTDPGLDHIMSSSRCPTKNCSGAIYEKTENKFSACNECGNKTFPDGYAQRKQDAISLAVMTAEKCENFADRGLDGEMVYQWIQEAVRPCSTILHPDNIYYIRLLDVTFFVCTTLLKYDEALKYGRRKIAPLNKLFPPSYPDKCSHFMEVGKMELYLGYFEEALKTFESVSETLYLVYGADHPTSLKMKEMIIQCRLEMTGKGGQPK